MKIAAMLMLGAMSCAEPVETVPPQTTAPDPAMVDLSPIVPPRDASIVDTGTAAPNTGQSVYGLPLGSDCSPADGGDPCAAASYTGPLIVTWGCYPLPGSTRHVCAFRCDDLTGVPLDGGSQVSYGQTAPPVCTQLGGSCVAAPGLAWPTEREVVLAQDGGAPSLCIVP